MRTRIRYEDLNEKQKEIYNFQKVAALLADLGYNCIKLADDWRGADFLAYHINGRTSLKVQLKTRLTIAKKYAGKNIYMVFRAKEDWYLIKHESLMKIIGQETNWLNTRSWLKEQGEYNREDPPDKVMRRIRRYRL